jgi:hypothetical protein
VLQSVHQRRRWDLSIDVCTRVREVLSTADGFHDPALRHGGANLLQLSAWWWRLHHGQRVLQQHR